MIAFYNARLIDGLGGSPAASSTIVINGAYIQAVGTDIPIPDGATAIDLGGKTLLPAFSDAHVHYGGTDLLSRPGMGGRDITYDYALAGSVNIKWGITTVRSAGDFMPDIVEYRSDAEKQNKHAPRIITAGRMFVAKGGHPHDTVFGGNQAIRDNACVICGEDTNVDAEVKALADAGVDWIKAVLSTINKMNYPHPVPRLPHETLKKIAEAAHRYGKPFMLHIESTADLEEALDLEVDSIEHLIGVGNKDFNIPVALLNRLRNSGVYIVPTLVSIKAHDGGLKGAEPVYPHLEKAVKTLADAGVKLAVGSDSAIPFVPFGECIHDEMELLVKLGIPPMEALCMATRVNCSLFKLEDVLGTVTAGKLADLVVLDDDPLADIRNTRRISLVLKEGRIVVDDMLA